MRSLSAGHGSWLEFVSLPSRPPPQKKSVSISIKFRVLQEVADGILKISLKYTGNIGDGRLDTFTRQQGYESPLSLASLPVTQIVSVRTLALFMGVEREVGTRPQLVANQGGRPFAPNVGILSIIYALSR